MRQKIVILLPVTALFFVSLLYLKTLAPTVLSGDGARFQLVALRLGISHPPGYPLYTLIAHLFSSIPLANPAFRVNLFSAVCGVLSLVSVYLITRKETGDVLIASLTCFVLAFSQMFWFLSIRAEVYTFYLLMLTIAIYFSLNLLSEFDTKTFWLSALFWGFYTSGRISALPSAFLFFAIVAIKTKPRLATLVSGAPFFFAPFLLSFFTVVIFDYFKIGYNYIDYYNQEFVVLPAADSLGHLLRRAKWILMAEQFRALLKFDVSVLVEGGTIFIRSLVKSNLTFLSILLSGLGFWHVLRGNISKALLLVGVMINNGAYFLFSLAGDRLTFLLPTFMILALLFAFGVRRLMDSLPAKIRPLMLTGFLCIPLFLVLSNYRGVDRSTLYGHEVLGNRVLLSAPPFSTVFVPWTFSTTLLFQQQVTGKRPDLTIVPMHEQNIQPFIANRKGPFYFLDLKEESWREVTQGGDNESL